MWMWGLLWGACSRSGKEGGDFGKCGREKHKIENYLMNE